jgi:Putative Flp pilus-assembly TadE/G-like
MRALLPDRLCRTDDERGTALLLIIGLAVVLLMTAAVVTDASAAYLQRQGLDTLADGAALTAADAGSSGQEVYGAGVGTQLHLDQGLARDAVLAYLHRADAYQRYPALAVQVTVDSTSQRVTVTLHAGLRLPLHVPGSPRRAEVGATGAASVIVGNG